MSPCNHSPQLFRSGAVPGGPWAEDIGSQLWTFFLSTVLPDFSEMTPRLTCGKAEIRTALRVIPRGWHAQEPAAHLSLYPQLIAWGLQTHPSLTPRLHGRMKGGAVLLLGPMLRGSPWDPTLLSKTHRGEDRTEDWRCFYRGFNKYL